MNKLIILTALLGCAAAAPGLYFHESHEPIHSITSPSKTTITKNSLAINHGGHEIVHVPVHQEVHLPVHQEVHALVHEPVHTLVHEPVHTLVHEPTYSYAKEPAKSSQYFKMENTVYKTSKVVPVHTKVITPVVSAAPVIHTPVYHSLVHAPVVSRTGDSAVSHQSSSTHETVHEVKHLPLYTLHH